MIRLASALSINQWYYLLGIGALLATAALFLWRKIALPLYRYGHRKIVRISDALDAVEAIRKEVFTNGGSSLRDSIDAMAKMVMQTARQVSMSIAQNRSLAEQMEIGIFEGDADGQIIWANRALRKVTGLRMEQINGTGWINAVHDDDRRRVENDWALATHHQRPFIQMFRFAHVGTGVSVPVHCEAYPVFSNSSSICSGWLGLLRTREVDT